MKTLLRRFGFQVTKASPEGEYRWSHTVTDYYPVFPRPRWMSDTLPHQVLSQALNKERQTYVEFLDMLQANAKLIDSIPFESDRNAPNSPYWNNTWFTGLDAAALVNFIAWKKPKNFMEIGSGHSTRFAKHAIQTMGLDTKITSIDPNPRQTIDSICNHIVRSSLETCSLAIFEQLEAGDILFFDGSHRSFTNSDVVVFFFEVLPRLKPGVIVQIHDIFIPYDYPEVWNDRLYNEQYILASMLLCREPPFRVLVPVSFICNDPTLGDRVKQIFSAVGNIPFLNPDPHGPRHPGGSFWIETKPIVSLPQFSS